jgi:CRISPR-associated exonuclease Cas4
MITGTHFNYFMICHRKLWLFANGMQMEHTSDLVYEGKLVHEDSYPQRAQKYTEIELDGIKIDFYDAKNKVVHEVKKSSKYDIAHEWQVKYYLYVLEKNGIPGATALLEYPRQRETREVLLSDVDREEIGQMERSIRETIERETCPEKLEHKRCRNCSYFDFCWSD